LPTTTSVNRYELAEYLVLLAQQCETKKSASAGLSVALRYAGPSIKAIADRGGDVLGSLAGPDAKLPSSRLALAMLKLEQQGSSPAPGLLQAASLAVREALVRRDDPNGVELLCFLVALRSPISAGTGIRTALIQVGHALRGPISDAIWQLNDGRELEFDPMVDIIEAVVDDDARILANTLRAAHDSHSPLRHVLGWQIHNLEVRLGL